MRPPVTHPHFLTMFTCTLHSCNLVACLRTQLLQASICVLLPGYPYTQTQAMVLLPGYPYTQTQAMVLRNLANFEHITLLHMNTSWTCAPVLLLMLHCTSCPMSDPIEYEK